MTMTYARCSRRRVAGSSLYVSATLAVLSASGCSYFEPQAPRFVAADSRVVLGRQESRLLYAHELADYTCPPELALVCELAGSRYFCSCETGD